MFRAGSIYVTTHEEICAPSRIQTQFCQSVYDSLAPYMYSTTDSNKSSCQCCQTLNSHQDASSDIVHQ